MTRESVLQLVSSSHEDDPEASSTPTVAPTLTTIDGGGPDGGSRAHPATLAARRSAAPSRLQLENEVVGFACDLLDAPATAVGNLHTSAYDVAHGVLLAAREERSYLRRPSVVLPDSAHPAFQAAALALGIVAIVVPTDHDGRAAIGAMTGAITQETVLVVTSAPSYHLGVVDPIPWLAAATGMRGVPLHVDATSGGWTMAYGARAGTVAQAWTFDLPGVTSIGIDLGPDEGLASELFLLLHRDSSTRSGLDRQQALLTGLGAWEPAGATLREQAETLREIGHDGCSVLAARALEATAVVCRRVADLRGIALVGRPEATTVALACDRSCDVFRLADELRQRGWATAPVSSTASRGAVLRLAVTAAMLPVVDEFVADLTGALETARGTGRAALDPALATMLEALTPERFNLTIAERVVEAAGVIDATEGADRVAATARLIETATPELRESLLMIRERQRRIPSRAN